MEFLQNLTSSEIWITFVGLITANLGTIIGVVIFAIKQALKRQANKEETEAELKKHVEECTAIVKECFDKVETAIDDMVLKLTTKIDATEAAKKAEIEAQKIELTNTINQTKQALTTIDDVLDA